MRPSDRPPEADSAVLLAPAVWGGDQQWATMVRWVLFALIHAEELGFTRALANDPPPDFVSTLLNWNHEEADALSNAMGVAPKWALRAVAAHLAEADMQLAAQAAHLDLLAEELRLAQQALNAITGEFTSDDLLGVIFSSFCIGK